MEEASEVAIARSKYRRFGPDSRDPAYPHSYTNADQIALELMDAQVAIDLAREAGAFSDLDYSIHKRRKLARLRITDGYLFND